MKLSDEVCAEVKETIFSNPNWSEVLSIVIKNSKSVPYLVGGKLYRTIIEVLYGYPARSECVDYDFVVTNINKKKKLPPGWKPKKRLGYPNVSAKNITGSIRLKSTKGCCIDIVHTKDVRQIAEGRVPEGIYGYLGSVPLDIQSIAMNLETGEIIGDRGIEAILSSSVGINNHESFAGNYFVKGWKHWLYYLEKKATSVKFKTSVKDKDKAAFNGEIIKLTRNKFKKYGFTDEQIDKLPDWTAEVIWVGPPVTIAHKGKKLIWDKKKKVWKQKVAKKKKKDKYVGIFNTSNASIWNWSSTGTGTVYYNTGTDTW